MTRPLAIVAATARNGVIGHDNALIWRLKTDLRRFRALTWGKPVIMGRKTFDSIGRPLPGRETVVLTRDRRFSVPGVRTAHDWEAALVEAEAAAAALDAAEVMVIGGAEVYALALPQAGRMYLTLVDTALDGDAVFPAWNPAAFREVRREPHPAGPDDEHAFVFVDLERFVAPTSA